MTAATALAGRAFLRDGDAPGLATCHALSDALDAALVEIAVKAPSNRPDNGAHESGVAVVAVGGYGRREQSRHSDIDLMLLFDQRSARSVTLMLYPLWDADLKVGHSVRTVDQAMEAGRLNVETLTALIDARLVTGDAALFGRFARALPRMLRGRQRSLERALRKARTALLAAEPWQLQEADVKAGRGGLRALQAIHWLDAAGALVRSGPPPPLADDLVAARDVLLATRNALHGLDERPNDRLRCDLAGPVAERLGEQPERWARRVAQAMRTIDAAAAQRLARPLPRRRLWGLLRPAAERDSGPEAATGATDLDRLLAAVRSADGRVLDPLPPADWIERLLPEWEVVRGLPHVAPFHRHAVDAHIWRTTHEARVAAREETEGTGTVDAAAHVDEVELLLSALLHDIGKGHEGDHSVVGEVIAERFATRAGLDAETARRLSKAAALHLLLPTVATRRDLSDPRVISETATQVGDASTLHLLYILSVADARATGPDVWSPWKAQLLRQLYVRVLELLSAEQPDAATAVATRRERVIAELAATHPVAEVAQHLDGLPATYLFATLPEAIAQHLDLIAQAAGGTAVRRDRAGAVDRLTVVTPDAPGMLSRVAGTLAVHNANVLGCNAYTRDDGVAIEVMHVTTPSGTKSTTGAGSASSTPSRSRWPATSRSTSGWRRPAFATTPSRVRRWRPRCESTISIRSDSRLSRCTPRIGLASCTP